MKEAIKTNKPVYLAVYDELAAFKTKQQDNRYNTKYEFKARRCTVNYQQIIADNAGEEVILVNTGRDDSVVLIKHNLSAKMDALIDKGVISYSNVPSKLYYSNVPSKLYDFEFPTSQVVGYTAYRFQQKEEKNLREFLKEVKNARWPIGFDSAKVSVTIKTVKL